MYAADALSLLMGGNARFAAGSPRSGRWDEERRRTILGGQKPIAAVLSCCDSRVTPEFLFDTQLGELFVVRTPGCVVDDCSLGALELAVTEFGVRLIVILGHDGCVSVEMAARSERVRASIGSFTSLIRPAIERARRGGASGPTLVDRAIDANVDLACEAVKSSAVVRHAVVDGAMVVRGRYRMETGVVDWRR